MSEKKKRKLSVLKIVGIILLIIIVVAGAIAYRYRSHIKAAVIWLTSSQEDIQKNIDAAKTQQNEALNSSGFHASSEADEALMKGEITAEQHTQILLGNTTLEQIRNSGSDDEPDDNTENTVSAIPDESESTQKDIPDSVGNKVEQPDNPPSPDTQKQEDTPGKNAVQKPSADTGVKDKPSSVTHQTNPESNDTAVRQPSASQPTSVQGTSDADKRIAELVTKMYVLKSEYTGAIEGVVSSMKADYVKLPPEQRTTSAKQSIAAGYMGKINAMEAQCDAQVNAIVSELRQILKENGRDMSLADAIVSTYASEKENTKAYYLSTYGD